MQNAHTKYQYHTHSALCECHDATPCIPMIMLPSTSAQIILIWAQDRDGVIGVNNKLPWHVPEDLQRFRELTWGSPIIMGSKTFAALPRKPLPGRKNIILSKNPAQLAKENRTMVKGGIDTATCGTITYVRTIAEAMTCSGNCEYIWVIGGRQVFDLMMGIAHRLEVTYIDASSRDAALAQFNIKAAPDELSLNSPRAFRENNHILDVQRYTYAPQIPLDFERTWCGTWQKSVTNLPYRYARYIRR